MEAKSVHTLLRDRTRQEIIRFLGRKGSASYSEILSHMKTGTGRLNYHLKVLTPLFNRDDDRYALNDFGNNACALLDGLEKQVVQDNRNIFRPLSWLFLAISPVSLYFGLISGEASFQFISILTLLIASFLLYYSGNVRFNFGEFLLISLMGFVLSLFSFDLKTTYYYNSPASTTLNFEFPTVIDTAILYATFIPWAMAGWKRWAIVVVPLAIVSLVAVMTVDGRTGSNVISSFSPPFPIVSVLIALILTVFMRFYPEMRPST
ncbi:MAG: winged helix-turn-helix domain-containing protein [Thermoplasmataceae archaeon]